MSTTPANNTTGTPGAWTRRSFLFPPGPFGLGSVEAGPHHTQARRLPLCNHRSSLMPSLAIQSQHRPAIQASRSGPTLKLP